MGIGLGSSGLGFRVIWSLGFRVMLSLGIKSPGLKVASLGSCGLDVLCCRRCLYRISCF